MAEALYTSSRLCGFPLYDTDFDYYLVTMLGANPKLTNDNNFIKNKVAFRDFIDSGVQAIAEGNDILAAQLCFDKTTEIRTNAQYYFNESTR